MNLSWLILLNLSSLQHTCGKEAGAQQEYHMEHSARVIRTDSVEETEAFAKQVEQITVSMKQLEEH